MPFCTSCGEPITANTTFCTHCGTKQGGGAAATPAPTPAAASQSQSASASASAPAGQGLSSNKGTDWLPNTFHAHNSSYDGSLAGTEKVLGELLDETNRTFGQLGVSVSAQRRPAGPSTTCDECHRPINGAAVQAVGKTLHPACLTCVKCFDQLTGESFIVRKQPTTGAEQAWCEACVQREKSSKVGMKPSAAGVTPFKPATTTTTSSSSGSGLTAAERDEFLRRRDQGKTSCASCGQVMMGDGVVAKNGDVFHPYCFACAKCGEEIEADSQYGMQGGKPVHALCMPPTSSVQCTGCNKALSGKFVRASDNKPYHKECFVCGKCRKDLSTGYTLRDGTPMCGPCASAATPFIKSTPTAVGPASGGIRYNQVTREVTHVATTTKPVVTSNKEEGSAGNAFCTRCGKSTKGFKFCPECGQKTSA